MNEETINEAFEYTPDTADSADAGDTAETVDTPDADGAEDIGTDDGAEAGDGDNNATKGGEGGEVQTADENARYAAARRQAEAERDKAISEANRRHEAEQRELITSLGLVNPYTGKPVTTKEELTAYKTASAEAHKKSFMEKNGLDDAAYNKFVGQLPEVVKANEAIAKAEAAAQSAKSTEARQRLDAEIEIISKLDPDIKSAEDLFKTEKYSEVLKHVRKGVSVSDAYKIVNFDKLAARSAAAERQRTLNAQTSKGHLNSTAAAHGQHLPPVPADEKEMYLLFNPEMSDEDIARDYHKRTKK